MNKKAITTLRVSMLAATCVGSVAFFGLNKNIGDFSKAGTEITRTARWDTWETITTSGGNNWGLEYYGQASGITKDETKVCTSVKVGSMIYPVDEAGDPVCFRNAVSIKVNYSADCEETTSAISIYNTNSPVIGDGVDDLHEFGGSNNNTAEDTYILPEGKTADRYIFLRIPTFSEVTINWFEITYSC